MAKEDWELIRAAGAWLGVVLAFLGGLTAVIVAGLLILHWGGVIH